MLTEEFSQGFRTLEVFQPDRLMNQYFRNSTSVMFVE